MSDIGVVPSGSSTRPSASLSPSEGSNGRIIAGWSIGEARQCSLWFGSFLEAHTFDSQVSHRAGRGDGPGPGDTDPAAAERTSARDTGWSKDFAEHAAFFFVGDAINGSETTGSRNA